MRIDKADKNFKINPDEIYYGENLLDDWTEDCPDWADQCNAVGKGSDEGDHKD